MDWDCCWNREDITADKCPYISEDEAELLHSLKRRVLEKCLECFRFRDDLQKMREQGHPLSDVLPYIIDEFQGLRSRIQSMTAFLDTKKREIRFLHELSVVLQTSMELDEVLSVAMTAITAGKGFGMNRAFLFLADKERCHLRGYLGVGPKNYEEAWQTWEDINRNNFNLKEMAKDLYRNKLRSEKMKFQDILDRLTVPLEEDAHIFNRALNDRKPILVEGTAGKSRDEQELAEVLGVESFLVMPLISRNRRIGVLITDNYVTHRVITAQDMQSLETFAFTVAFAIERASLYEQLQEKLDKLTAANLKLKEQQELIVRMEKMALVGKITSSIAHSIRNPLMVIGGFARSLLKNVTDEDPNREYLQSIVREARQLDDVLEEVLAYSDSLYPTRDLWDVNHLLMRLYQDFRERIERDRIDCSLQLAADLPPAFIDYKQITFCTRNIFGAALDLVPEGGGATVRTWNDDDAVMVDIKVGGNPGAGAVAFNAFGVDSPGLSLCKTILEKQEIPFRIESREGEGTRFTLRLPMKGKEET